MISTRDSSKCSKYPAICIPGRLTSLLRILCFLRSISVVKFFKSSSPATFATLTSGVLIAFPQSFDRQQKICLLSHIILDIQINSIRLVKKLINSFCRKHIHGVYRRKLLHGRIAYILNRGKASHKCLAPCRSDSFNIIQNRMHL